MIDGQLGAPYLNELLRELHGAQSSNDLRLAHGNDRGLIALRGGELVHASIERVRTDVAVTLGSGAVYDMLSWSSGSFNLIRPSDPIENTIFAPLNDLLLEGLRRLDNIADIRRRLPPCDTVLELVRTPRGVITTPLSPLELRILEAIDGKRTLGEHLERSVVGVALCGQIVLRLLSIGLIRPKLGELGTRLLDCDSRTIFPVRETLWRRVLVLLNPLTDIANATDPIVAAVMTMCTGAYSALEIAAALDYSEPQVLAVLDHLSATKEVRLLRKQ